MSASIRFVSLLLCLAAPGCTLLRSGSSPDAVAASSDPAKGEVPLAAADGWEGRLLLDNGAVGVWTVKSFPVFSQYAVPDVVGLDDQGRCHVLISYSGKWTPLTVVHDGKWLGGLAHGDIDPRIEGAELYTGGEKGNLYQVVPYPDGVLDCRKIAHLPGREIHTIVAGDLDPRNSGPELLVFTRPGGLYLVTPTGSDGRFEVSLLEDLKGRVRDALVLPPVADRGPSIATLSRSGRLEILRLTERGAERELVHEANMGMGRLARRKFAAGQPLVLYSTLDDGRILRHERGLEGWHSETIYLGEQGARGLASGRFHEDDSLESLVVFGYDRKVRLLTHRAEGWQGETLFEDRDKGHWLSVAELDGRNVTDEILASGYGGRIVMLTRPAGFGRPEPTAP